MINQVGITSIKPLNTLVLYGNNIAIRNLIRLRIAISGTWNIVADHSAFGDTCYMSVVIMRLAGAGFLASLKFTNRLHFCDGVSYTK